MKKSVLFILLGLFVAGLAAYAVPQEMKDNPEKSVFEVFLVSENVVDYSIPSAETVFSYDADVGSHFDFTYNQNKEAIELMPAEFSISGVAVRQRYWCRNEGMPTDVNYKINQPASGNRHNSYRPVLLC